MFINLQIQHLNELLVNVFAVARCNMFTTQTHPLQCITNSVFKVRGIKGWWKYRLREHSFCPHIIISWLQVVFKTYVYTGLPHATTCHTCTKTLRTFLHIVTVLMWGHFLAYQNIQACQINRLESLEDIQHLQMDECDENSSIQQSL